MNNNQYKRLMSAGLVWAFFISVLRALRWPNDWAEAHWLINYDFGFIKRGLPGALISPLINYHNFNENAEIIIRVVSGVFFFIFCVGLCWICGRIIKKSQFKIQSISFCLLFLTSPYVVMSAHLNGYYDNLIIIISVLACLLLMRGQILFSSIVLSVGILVHEIVFLLGLPVLIFLALIKYIKETESSSYRRLILGFCLRYHLLFAIPFIVFGCLVVYQTLFLDRGQITQQLISHLSQFDFIRNGRSTIVPTAFTTPFIDYFITESPQFFFRITIPVYVIHIGLPLCLLLYYGWYRLRMAALRMLIFLSLLAVTVLPLSLHLIAWDTSRIWTFPMIVVTVAVWGISEFFPDNETEAETPLFFCIIAALVTFSQLFFQIPLMDGVHENFSGEVRIILYSPSLLLIVWLISNKYRIEVISKSPVEMKDKMGQIVPPVEYVDHLADRTLRPTSGIKSRSGGEIGSIPMVMPFRSKNLKSQE